MAKTGTSNIECPTSNVEVRRRGARRKDCTAPVGECPIGVEELKGTRTHEHRWTRPKQSRQEGHRGFLGSLFGGGVSDLCGGRRQLGGQRRDALRGCEHLVDAEDDGGALKTSDGTSGIGGPNAFGRARRQESGNGGDCADKNPFCK